MSWTQTTLQQTTTITLAALVWSLNNETLSLTGNAYIHLWNPDLSYCRSSRTTIECSGSPVKVKCYYLNRVYSHCFFSSTLLVLKYLYLMGFDKMFDLSGWATGVTVHLLYYSFLLCFFKCDCVHILALWNKDSLKGKREIIRKHQKLLWHSMRTWTNCRIICLIFVIFKSLSATFCRLTIL